MNKQPLVSVVMAAYNAERFVEEAIRSVLGQTYPKLELIIVDDGSTDRTWPRIRRLAKRNKRIRAYRLKRNTGPSEASNMGLSHARGAFIARMDADDISYPTRIEKQVAFLQKHPRVLLVGGQCDIIDESGAMVGEKRFPVHHEYIKRALFTMNPIQHPSSMYRRRVFTKLGIRYEKRYFVSHDLKILFKLLPYGELANLPDTILKYRHRPDSITHKHPKRVFAETVEIRHWAMLRAFYQPHPTAILIHLLQIIAVGLLPNQVISSLFWLWRVQSWEPVREMFRFPVSLIQRQAFRLAPAILLIPFLRDSK